MGVQGDFWSGFKSWIADQGTTYMMRERFGGLRNLGVVINDRLQNWWKKIPEQALGWVFEYLRRENGQLFSDYNGK